MTYMKKIYEGVEKFLRFYFMKLNNLVFLDYIVENVKYDSTKKVVNLISQEEIFEYLMSFINDIHTKHIHPNMQFPSIFSLLFPLSFSLALSLSLRQYGSQKFFPDNKRTLDVFESTNRH